MRITNSTIARNYTRNLNSNLGLLNKYSTMTQTGRKLTTMSDNTSLGMRALQLRRSIENVESHKETAQSVLSTFGAAEDQMAKVVDLGKDIYVLYEQALNGTNAEDELKAISAGITQYRDQMLACANGQFNERFMFGGTNTGEPPFTAGLDANGKDTLFYNGVDVRDIKDPATGTVKPEYQYLFDDAAYVDIGLGLRENPDGSLVETSAFKSTLNGLDFLGYGDDNIYLVCNEILDALKNPDFANEPPYDELLNRIQGCYKEVTLSITELGSQYQYLEYTVDRLETESLNLIERQQSVEFIDPAEAIMQWKMQEYSYNAALQMGQRLLQPTLFNFIS